MKTRDGLWRLSPSGLYGYTECTSCFWIDNHFKRAPMLPLLLNSAMDSILKARYDKYRSEGVFPPEAGELATEGLQPFTDFTLLEQWREDYNALKITDKDIGYVMVGKIDDVLVEEDGRLVPADYKSSGNPPSVDKQKYYKDQLAAYGLMFQKLGNKVSDRAYLLHYFVENKLSPDVSVKFDSHVDKVDINVSELEQKLADIVALLNDDYPGPNKTCDKCSYYQGRSKLVESTQQPRLI